MPPAKPAQRSAVNLRNAPATPAEAAADAEARRLRVQPEILRAPENRTHLNARGYTLIEDDAVAVLLENAPLVVSRRPTASVRVAPRTW